MKWMLSLIGEAVVVVVSYKGVLAGGNRFAAMAADAIRRQTAALGYIENPKAH